MKINHQKRAIQETKFVKRNGELKSALYKMKHDKPSDFDYHYKW